jgi:hypothetical protein
MVVAETLSWCIENALVSIFLLVEQEITPGHAWHNHFVPRISWWQLGRQQSTVQRVPTTLQKKHKTCVPGAINSVHKHKHKHTIQLVHGQRSRLDQRPLDDVTGEIVHWPRSSSSRPILISNSSDRSPIDQPFFISLSVVPFENLQRAQQ